MSSRTTRSSSRPRRSARLGSSANPVQRHNSSDKFRQSNRSQNRSNVIVDIVTRPSKRRRIARTPTESTDNETEPASQPGSSLTQSRSQQSQNEPRRSTRSVKQENSKGKQKADGDQKQSTGPQPLSRAYASNDIAPSSASTSPRKAVKRGGPSKAAGSELSRETNSELKRRLEQLELRFQEAERKEAAAATLIDEFNQRKLVETFTHIETNFTCSLCCDIMSCPLTLTPALCGHTFCCMCIVKWFFSRMHTPCGAWHESVDCPICRALLPITPDVIPRNMVTFPFAPNRLVESLLRDAFADLDKSLSLSAEEKDGKETETEKEEENDKQGPAAKKKASSGKGKGKGKGKEVEPACPGITGWENVLEWRIGGSARKDWAEREREGKKWLTDLMRRWPRLLGPDFCDIRSELGISSSSS